MSKGKYVLPVILGQPGRELFFVKGEIPKGQDIVLARKLTERMVIDRDRKHIERLIKDDRVPAPQRVTELEVVVQPLSEAISDVEASLIHHYVNNTLPGAFKSPMLSQWFVFERPGDITPLKLARFAINLLSNEERRVLLSVLGTAKLPSTHTRFAAFC